MKIEQVIGLRRLIVVKHWNYATKSENDDMEMRIPDIGTANVAIYAKEIAAMVGSGYS